MMNYYTYENKTAENFFNDVVINYINNGKKIGEKVVHVLIWNLSVGAIDLMRVAKAHNYDATIRNSRTLVIRL